MYSDCDDSGRHKTTGPDPDPNRKTYLAMPISPPQVDDEEQKVIYDKYVYLCNYCKNPMTRDITSKTPWFKCASCNVQCSDTAANKMTREDWEFLRKNPVQTGQSITTENGRDIDIDICPAPASPAVASEVAEVAEVAEDGECYRCGGPVVQDRIDKNWFKCSRCELLLAEHLVTKAKGKRSSEKNDLIFLCKSCGKSNLERTNDPEWLCCPTCGNEIHEDWDEFLTIPKISKEACR